MSVLRGSGCFKALNTPVTLTIQPTKKKKNLLSLFKQYCMFLFRLFKFRRGWKVAAALWKGEAFGKVKGVVGVDVPWDHKERDGCYGEKFQSVDG